MAKTLPCCQSAASQQRIVRSWRSLASTLPLGFTFLLPKCPLCFLAWAAAFGIGVNSRRALGFLLQPSVRPALVALFALPLLLRLYLAVRRRGPTHKQTA